MEKILNQCPKVNFEFNKDDKVLIFGGSGSLGCTIIKRWIRYCPILNVSRDEEKQWNLKNMVNNLPYQTCNLEQYIGDISNYNDVEDIINKYNPTIIIIAACLKHIDICEKFPMKAIQNNVNGLANVQKAINKCFLKPKTVLFVSTDKACNPITTYGYSKSLAESLIQSSDLGTRYISIRYGNVLNSSGSIIPYLQNVVKNNLDFNLTHPNMTRFLMTLDQSVNLIEYSLQNANHREIIVPYLCSMKIKDLFELFAKNKKINITGLRCKEKIHEDLISESEALNCYSDKTNNYIHITPDAKHGTIYKFDSSDFIVSSETLSEFLKNLNLI